jgi:hypothetical protein
MSLFKLGITQIFRDQRLTKAQHVGFGRSAFYGSTSGGGDSVVALNQVTRLIGI